MTNLLMVLGLWAVSAAILLYPRKENKIDIDETVKHLEADISYDRMLRYNRDDIQSQADERHCQDIEKLIERVKE